MAELPNCCTMVGCDLVKGGSSGGHTDVQGITCWHEVVLAFSHQVRRSAIIEPELDQRFVLVGGCSAVTSVQKQTTDRVKPSGRTTCYQPTTSGLSCLIPLPRPTSHRPAAVKTDYVWGMCPSHTSSLPWFNVAPASQTVAQHQANNWSMYRVCWVYPSTICSFPDYSMYWFLEI